MQKDDIAIRNLDELAVEGIATLDEVISGRYRPEIWDQRAMYYLRRDPEGSFVAEAAGRIVGFMLGEVRAGEFGVEEPIGWIETLGVDPEFRGRAVGRRLAAAVLARFRNQGVTTVRTLINDDMPEVLAFFEALSFEPAAVKTLILRLNGDTHSVETES